MSPLNKNFWHGSTELNIMTFVFFTFIVSPHLTQNCWSVSNCCCNPTFNSDVRTRSSAKSNNQRAYLSKSVHHILCRLNAPLGHPNIAQTIGGWEDNLVSHLAGTWSWRWHPRLGGWCVWYSWHTLPVGIARSVPSLQGQPTPTTASRGRVSNTFFKSTKQQ